MGNDGGSIPTRRELVREAAKALTTTQVKEVQTEQQEYAWSTDPISRKPLSRPVVSDSVGKLYNKDSILEYLLPSDDSAAKAEAEKVLDGRVKSLKDVVEVKFEVAEGKMERTNGDLGRTERWLCPITNRELGPGAKAVYLVPCGHAFAGSVVKEISGETCLQCNEPYAENDIIPILSIAPTDIARLSLRMETLREKGLAHSLKKGAKDKKKKKHADKAASGVKVQEDLSNEEAKKTAKPAKRPSPALDLPPPTKSNHASNGIRNSATASLTAKVLEEQEARNKKRKLDKTLFSSNDQTPSMKKSGDFMNRGFTIPAGAKRWN
ncbi:DUF602-domain-containing protein [Lophium mytilinum]|uniref:DUF602-domain-containing protein n=1 Tax=Lophium mytilinum TaxID=390894 RepID=A0A6A6R7D7_9PEZI|nr:DUF602-domain-containing protein [Lophium mytilinum]